MAKRKQANKRKQVDKTQSLADEVLSTSISCFKAIADHHEISPENATAYSNLEKSVGEDQVVLFFILPHDDLEQHADWKLPEVGSEQYAAFDNYTSARIANVKRLELKLQHIHDNIYTNPPSSSNSAIFQQAWIQPALNVVNEQIGSVPDEVGCKNVPTQCIIAAMKLSIYLVRCECFSLVKEWSMCASYLHQIEMMLSLASVSMSFQRLESSSKKYLIVLNCLMNFFDTILDECQETQLKNSSVVNEGLENACHVKHHARQFRMMLDLFVTMGA